ncbi:hypothetical protein [Pendulispora albinea]|uniref:Tetratricopeptide repeat protein n=1 Tax=Pendulispora albinea TaxID=2741071 RepID=A0ABZ2MA38_9BACT
MVHPLEELNDALGSFVAQGERFGLLLTTRDEEVPLVVKALDALDEQSPPDVFFVDATPVRNGKQYADDVVRNAWAQLVEVNAERRARGQPPLAEVPGMCWSEQYTPMQRLAALIRHMLTWLPPDGDHRLIVALLPASIHDRDAHARIVGALLPFGDYEPWMTSIRVVVRDDGAVPFAATALRTAGVRNVLLYTTRVTVAGIADAIASDAANTDLSPVRRINALLQCAGFDLALGRYNAALDKYGVLYTYYDRHGVPEMKAVVVQGVGDVMFRIGRFPAARDKYLQALEIASEARSLMLIMHICAALGDADLRLQGYAEAAKTYAIGAAAAEKLGNGFARADLLEKCGQAHATLGDLRGAGEAWTQAAVTAREVSYDPRLGTVLERLRDLCARGGYHDLAADYDRELREVRRRSGA